MKTFTYPQKKWVLTGALLAVLGINVSFNSHKYGIASADFASNDAVVEGKIPTAKGIIPVKYIDNGEDKVLAIVPKKLTQGKVCEDCGFESISLNVKNKKDIDALNVELLNVISKTKDTVLTASESTEKKTEVEAESAKKDFFAKLDSCDNKKSNSAILSCRNQGFIKILKANTKAIDAEDAHTYYKQNIENLIKNEISESRRIVNRMRRAQAMRNSNFFNEDESSESPGEMRDQALSQIRELIGGIPGKFESIRKRLISAETEIAKAEAEELQQTYVQSQDNKKDPAMRLYLTEETLQRRADLNQLIVDMRSDTREGLSGLDSKDINASLKNQYMEFLNEYLTKLEVGMYTNLSNFTGSGNGNTTLPGMNFSGRVQNPRRSSGTVVVPSNVSNRTGNRINF